MQNPPDTQTPRAPQTPRTTPPVRVELISTLDEKYVANTIAFTSMIASAVIFVEGASLRLPNGELDVAQIRDRFEAASESIPAFRQRLVRTPLGITAPAWIPVTRLDMREHVTFHPDVIADDASSVELLTGRHNGQMSLERPLWDVRVFDLDSGRIALVTRYHHVVGDALYGLEVGDIIWPTHPRPAIEGAAPELLEVIGSPPRSRVEILTIAGRDWMRAQPSLRGAVREYVRKPFVKRLRRWGGRILRPMKNRRIVSSGLIDRVIVARHSRFAEFDLALAVKSAYRMGGTINDLIVSIALRAVLDTRPDVREAAILVPISRRAKGDTRIRNHISVVRVTATRDETLAEIVASVRRQVQHSVDTGESAVEREGDWAGYATYVTWGRAQRYFGEAPIVGLAGWPAGDPHDDIALLGCAYGKTLTLSLTTKATTDIDALFASMTRSISTMAGKAS